MKEYCKENLYEIRKILENIDDEMYRSPLLYLSNASIGQHVRHILEFYICLMDGIPKGNVNYDKRERNLELENNPKFAVHTISKICSNLCQFYEDKPLLLIGDFASEEEADKKIKTSVFREMAYCLEHSIHHQALIKIGMIEQGIEQLLNENFGVAPATIRFKNNIANN
jgi:uncharacterized damage-inducible protein DinB